MEPDFTTRSEPDFAGSVYFSVILRDYNCKFLIKKDNCYLFYATNINGSISISKNKHDRLYNLNFYILIHILFYNINVDIHIRKKTDPVI